jgi:hypothetical protein
MTRQSSAQVMWSGPLNVHVGFGAGDGSEYVIDLPGTAGFRFTASSGYGNALVIAGRTYSGGRATFKKTSSAGHFHREAALVEAGRHWGTIGGTTNDSAGVGRIKLSDHSPVGRGSYDHKYLAFQFQDSTAGDALRYGWVKVSGVIGGANTPSVTIEEWAYEASGVDLATGATAVPEPRETALATGLALVAGAAGLGGWRRKLFHPPCAGAARERCFSP